MKALSVVLLPGLDGTGDLFQPFIASTPSGIEPIVVEYPITQSSIDFLEDRVREKLTEQCVVVAESFSGPIAVRVATDARVRALVLCNSFVNSPFPPWLRHFMVAPLFSVPPPRLLIRSALLGADASPLLVDQVQAVIRRLPAALVAERVRQVLETDERRTVRVLAKPVLYLRGLRDNLVSQRSWKDLATVRPDAEIAQIEGPHLLLQVRPDECWRAIMKFALKSAAG